MQPLEKRTISVGFILVGLAIAVTAVSYFLNMTFRYQWLVWAVAAAFAIVALLALEWPRALSSPGKVPERRLQQFLVLSIPLAFLMSSQVCGLGLQACNGVCHVTNLALIGLAGVIAFRLHKGQPVGAFLVPLVVIALVPHCVCHAPINTLWHRMLGGVAPTCEMVPLAAVLFSVFAVRGVRLRSSTALVVVLFAVMLFIIVGSTLFGFPWQGCVDHVAA